MRLLKRALLCLLIPAWVGATDFPLGTVPGITFPTTGGGGGGITGSGTAGNVTIFSGPTSVTNFAGSTCSPGKAVSISAAGALGCSLVSLTADVSGVLGVANGGTNLRAAADDNVMVGNGTTWQTKALTTCTAASDAMTYDASTNTFGCHTISGGAGSPAPPDGSVQYNASSAFAGDAAFTYFGAGDYAYIKDANGGLFINDSTWTTSPNAFLKIAGKINGYVSDVYINGSAVDGHTAPVGLEVVFGQDRTGTDYTGTHRLFATYSQSLGKSDGSALLGPPWYANTGVGAISGDGSTGGMNAGLYAEAGNSTAVNVGSESAAVSATGGTNIGVLGRATSSTQGTNFKNVGGLFTLASNTGSINIKTGSNISAALIADNAAEAAPIFNAYDNGTLVFSITDGGPVTMTSTLVSTRTSDFGWALVSGANTACNTTCTYACVVGEDTATHDLVACTDATADVCVCAGPN